jgi:hypothetical protein
MEVAMKIALVLAAALLAPAAASAASPAGPANNACFRTRDIAAHRKGDDHTLYLKVGLKDFYRVTTKSSCLRGMMRSDALVIDGTPSGLVCSPVEFDLGVRQSGGFVTPCIVDSITRLTPPQAAALPKNVRP